MDHIQTGCKICAEFNKYNSIDCSVYVTDLPFGVVEHELISFFSQFDDIEDFYFPDNGHYCIVQFIRRRTCDFLLNNPVFMFGRRLKIRQRNQDKPKETYYDLPSVKSVCEAVSLKPSFQSQVNELISLLEPKEDTFEKYHQICNDLRETLAHISPSYQVMPFGSSVNGLAFKGSDVDVFFGEDSGEDKDPVGKVFQKATAALTKSAHFEHVSQVPRARVPIIKFVHKRTNIHCDLSFRNMLGVQNSKLVKFLTTVDERVRPFFMIVKYWAKVHSITGKQFSNYALTLLLTNFLQSLSDPILPPIYKLQHANVKPIRIGCWNANFDDDISRLKPVSNTSTLFELLSRFFRYMANTNFSDYVICPIIGKTVRKSKFCHPESLPVGMAPLVDYCLSSKKSLKMDSPLCIQDPVESHFIVSGNLKYNAFRCFRDHCYAAAQLLSVPSVAILSQLLTLSSLLPKNTESVHQYVPHDSSKYEVTLRLCCEDLNAANYFNKILLVFEKVLNFQVECLNKSQSGSTNSDQWLNWHCQSDQILWLFRDRLWDKLFPQKCQQMETAVNGDKDDENEEEIQVIEIIRNGLVIDVESDIDGRMKKKRKWKSDTEDTSRNIYKRQKGDFNVVDSCRGILPSLRSISDEIKLSEEMVRCGHAPHARHIILDFKCTLRQDESMLVVVISNQSSRITYLESLCDFLQKALPKWVEH